MTLALPAPAQVEPECLPASAPPPPTASLALGSWKHGEGRGMENTLFPVFTTTQTLHQVPASAVCVCMTVEGNETTEESGILGSNPSSDIYFLDSPGEL